MALVFILRYLDVLLLHFYPTCHMESTPQKLGLILKYFSEFTDEQIAQLTALEELYKEWNAKINVISRKDIESIYLHHVLHSLSIAAIADFNRLTEEYKNAIGGLKRRKTFKRKTSRRKSRRSK